ncbi:zinc-dependent alcohol dehydrogenase family protein [Tardiphaga sp.]|uniref:zinc-dependent alcohol dehydrogenase family protein n=1 Tax=Tardiphaga sp. TaxID=1926292 RepID=UPI0026343C2A|nr:zinc-dependent alcohol dehydrogenase family protein [Tardiphaga sp.]MDB5617857.1 quinone oxidoreductase [Tardiphaga sp.]
MSLPPFMTAAVLTAPNAPFRIEQVALPVAAANQVLVRVKASGVNPLDLKIYSGEAAHARHPLPGTLGMDLAGVIEGVGASVTQFRPGDEVFGFTGGVGGVQGSLAQFAAVDADLLALKPVNLGMREAAALPLVVITAWEGLVDRAGISAGQTVLIHGGAGGVGHVAIQIARAFGGTVSATGAAKDKDIIEHAGATFIDYAETTVSDYVARHTAGRGFDVVYDTVGGATLDASFSAVARFGHVVSALGWGTHALAPLSFRAASYSGVFTLLPLLTGEGRARHGEILREAAKLYHAGKLAPRLDVHRYALHTITDAYDAIRSKTASGKIVIDVTDDLEGHAS